VKKKIAIPLADDSERRRFVEIHDKNISVIAPAGVGKTRGIVDRILQIARDPRAEELLPRLVVVTFSVAAAQEMQSRTRVGIRAQKISAPVQRAFQQTFFGTIHSFCLRLLSRYGHYLGLPGALNLPQSEEELWERFLIHGARHDPLADPALADLFHFYTVEDLYGLGRTVAPAPESMLGPMPFPQVQKLIDFSTAGLHPSTRKAVALRQQALAAWNEMWAKGDRFQQLPSCAPNPPEFVELWRETFAPLNDWLRLGALEFGRRVRCATSCAAKAGVCCSTRRRTLTATNSESSCAWRAWARGPSRRSTRPSASWAISSRRSGRRVPISRFIARFTGR